MEKDTLSTMEWFERFLLALLFIVIGTIIMIVFSPWKPLLGRVDDYLGRVSLIIILTVVVWVVQKSKHFQKYGEVFYGLLILTIAVSLDWIMGIYLIKHVGVGDNTPAGWALQKLNECIVIISTVIILTT